MVGEPATELGGSTIVSFGDGLEVHCEDLFEGHWRKKIDDYRHQQDKIRARPKLGELRWWQEVSGI